MSQSQPEEHTAKEARAAEGDTLKGDTLKGVGWSGVGKVTGQVLSFVVGVVLARLLTPRQFGLLAMVTVISNFAENALKMGFRSAIVQHKDLRAAHLSSVFWLQLGGSVLLMAGFMAGAPLIARFYEEPLLVPLTVVISVNFLLRALTIVQHALMSRAMDFRTIAIVQIVSVVLAGGVAIAMAFTGFGVWSLVGKVLISSCIGAALLWWVSDWRPRFSFDWGAVKELLGFSANAWGYSTLNYWGRNADNLLIAKFLGSSALGLYSKAYAVLMFPLLNINGTIGRVMFPSFSRIQDDKPRMKRVFLRMIQCVALVSFPLMTGLAAVNESFVLGVFGEQWAGMIPLVYVFCLAGMIRTVTRFFSGLYLAQGNAALLFRVGLATKAAVLLGIVLGLQGGVEAVAWGLTAALAATAYPLCYFAGRPIDMTFADVLRALSGVTACAAAMGALVYLLGLGLPEFWSHWARLGVQVPFGVLAYLVLVHVFDVNAYREVRQLLAERGYPSLAPA